MADVFTLTAQMSFSTSAERDQIKAWLKTKFVAEKSKLNGFVSGSVTTGHQHTPDTEEL